MFAIIFRGEELYYVAFGFLSLLSIGGGGAPVADDEEQRDGGR